MIKNFLTYFKEINTSEFNQIKSDEISNSFTISLEIELETDDYNVSDKELSKNQIDNFINLIRNRVTSQLLKFNNLNINKLDKYKKFIEDVLLEVKEGIDDEEYIEDLLNIDSYSDDVMKGIIELIEPLVQTYFYTDNIFYLKNKLKSELPDFWKKWKNEIKYEADNTLERGIEISMNTYIKGINRTIEFINDFYNDFENQNYWKFKQTTGIHINIGVNYKANWNIIKGVLILNDADENPFLFKGMEWRKDSIFTNTIKKAIFNLSKEEKEKILSNVDLHNINNVEKYLNTYLYDLVKKLGYKNFGFNISSTLTDNYVEFRYPGGKISKNTLIEKLLYFCYIVYCMTNANFKKKDYQKKIFLFFNKLSVF